MIYYTSLSSSYFDLISEKNYLGAIIGPIHGYKLRPEWDVIADNGCFSNKWKEDTWYQWISNFNEKGVHPRFVVCPDVVDLSGENETHPETLDLWNYWAPKIRKLGHSPAFVLQRGAKYNNLPSDAEYLFIGGDTEFKLGKDVEKICEVFSDKLWIHMGRVNSKKRLNLAKSWGCKSADGTFLSFAPKNNVPRLIKWFEGNNEKMNLSENIEAKKPSIKDKSVKLRTISYGGGVQSTAMCVLAAQGKLDDIMGGPIDAAVFANVGDDSEHPDTIDYVRNIMIPWSKKNGLNIVEVSRETRNGSQTLMQKMQQNKSSLPIPVKMSNGAPGTRSCTVDFKIRTIHKWIKSQGVSIKSQSGSRNHRSKLTQETVDEIRSRYASEKISMQKLSEIYSISKTQISDIINHKVWTNLEDTFAVVAIGISTDEIQRIRRKTEEPHEIVVYPLIELGLDRDDCKKIIADAGLPVPPKSACFFCPFHGKDYWRDMRSNRPDLWEQTVSLEKLLNNRRKDLGKDDVFITKAGTYIENLFDDEDSIDDHFNDGKCDEGYCWT